MTDLAKSLQRVVVVTLVAAASLTSSFAQSPSAEADAQALRDRGLAALNRADYQTARTELETSRDAFDKAGNRLGVAQDDLSLAREAEMSAAWDRLRTRGHLALDAFTGLGDVVGQVRSIRQLTRDSQMTRADRDALIERAVALARTADHPTLLAEMLEERGGLEFGRGDYTAAMADFEIAIDRFERANSPQQLSTVLVDLGRVYRAHGQPDRAIPYYERALGLQQSLGDSQAALQSINAIAVARDLLGQHAEAVVEYQRALALARDTGAPRLMAFALGNLGGTYVKGAEWARAAPLLNEALALPNDPFVKAIRQSQLAEAYRHLGRYSEAAPLIDAAIALDRENRRGEGLVEDLTERAELRGLTGETDLALADVREALANLETIRARLVPRDVMKQGFTRLYQDTYETAIGLLTRRHDDAAALETSEQARSRAFLDLLATRDLRAAADPASEAEVRATARRLRSTMVVYFVTPDATFAWVAGPDAVHAHRIDVSSQRLAALVKKARPSGAGGSAIGEASDASAWKELYSLLFAPLRAELPRDPGARLTIVPHGPLFLLSFAALQSPAGRYLVEDYTIHYAPSVAVLRFTEARHEAVSPRDARYLLVGDPSGVTLPEASRPLPPLPGARREIADIARLVPAGRADVLTGASARTVDVRAQMPNATVVHFATHAVIRDDAPLESFLALGGTPLTAEAVYALNLQSDLVVLSACRTALGQISGDGIAGLTRAFFYAGAASVMATMWDVADEPTVRLVREFYRLRVAGRDKAEALRAAQLRLLGDLRAGRISVDTPDGPMKLKADPFFWAGFVLDGEP